MQTLLNGLVMGEAPRWREGRVYLTDFGAGEVIAADLAGNRDVVATTRSLGLGVLPDGTLLIVSMMDDRLLRLDPNGTLETYADLPALDHHPWNDLVVDGRGNAYVDNVGFDFPGGTFAPGTIALVTPDRAVHQVAGDLAFPNGLAVTPDNSTLIVAESYGECLTAFDVATDGTLANRRTWATTAGDHPDGICIDADGAVWYADVVTKRCVRVREGGDVLDTVRVDRACYSCTLGGPDGRTLFIAAAEFAGGQPASGRTGVLLATDAPAAHAGWP